MSQNYESFPESPFSNTDCGNKPKQEPQPVLIKASTLYKELCGRKMHDLAEDLKNHFSKPENQYKPKQEPEKMYSLDEVRLITARLGCSINSHEEIKLMIEVQQSINATIEKQKMRRRQEKQQPAASEPQPVFEVGDTVKCSYFINHLSLSFTKDHENLLDTPGEITQRHSFSAKVHCLWWDLSALTLVKKADKPASEPDNSLADSPFDIDDPHEKKYSDEDVNLEMMKHSREVFTLEDARKLYREGGEHGKYVAGLFYTVDELTAEKCSCCGRPYEAD